MFRCLKIAIVHDVAEGVLRETGRRCFVKFAVCSRVTGGVLVVLRVRVFCMIAAIVGDITPVDGVSDADKHQLEAAAMARIRDTLGSDTAAGLRTMTRTHLRRRRRAYQHDSSVSARLARVWALCRSRGGGALAGIRGSQLSGGNARKRF